MEKLLNMKDNKSFNFLETAFDGLFIMQRRPINDKRGLFERMFCSKELSDFLGTGNPVQVNRSITCKKGTVRGMHYQLPPYTEDKVVTCIHGTVYDVVIDLRADSKTFLKWFSLELNSKSHKSILIPRGFAHGFQSLSDDAEMLYYHTNLYSPSHEKGINPLDKTINIDWPLPINEITEKDRSYALIDSSFSGVTL